jgi:hypothetical protein
MQPEGFLPILKIISWREIEMKILIDVSDDYTPEDGDIFDAVLASLESSEIPATLVAVNNPKYYLIDVAGGVEPTIEGPYADNAELEKNAHEIRGRQDEDDTLFAATVTAEGGLEVDAFSGAFFEEDGEKDE